MPSSLLDALAHNDYEDLPATAVSETATDALDLSALAVNPTHARS